MQLPAQTVSIEIYSGIVRYFSAKARLSWLKG